MLNLSVDCVWTGASDCGTNGDCVSGACVCTNGYTGNDCSTAPTGNILICNFHDSNQVFKNGFQSIYSRFCNDNCRIGWEGQAHSTARLILFQIYSKGVGN